jgi:hypothetical protein
LFKIFREHCHRPKEKNYSEGEEEIGTKEGTNEKNIGKR